MNSKQTLLKDKDLEFGLSETVRKDIQNVFKQFDNIDKVIIFGSRAKGRYRAGSDVDLAVVGSNLSFDNLLDIHLKIDDLSLLYKIDLVAYEEQKESPLSEQIRNTGEIFYQKK